MKRILTASGRLRRRDYSYPRRLSWSYANSKQQQLAQFDQTGQSCHPAESVPPRRGKAYLHIGLLAVHFVLRGNSGCRHSSCLLLAAVFFVFGVCDFTGLYQLVYLLLRFCAPGLCLRFLGFFFEYSNCAGYLYCYASCRSSLSPLACFLGLKSAKSVRWALFLLDIMPFSSACIATIIGGFQSK